MNPYKVCILAAGRGERMGEYTSLTHKALLPLGKKAILSKIIELLPQASEYVIAVGKNSDLIENYVELAHKQQNVKVVKVQKHQGKGSGPGRSLWECRNHLFDQAFVCVCADTLWSPEESLFFTKDWIGVQPVPATSASRFCVVRGHDYVTNFIDKTPQPETETVDAFVGAFFISDPARFFVKEPLVEVKGEVQLSALLEPYNQQTPLVKKTIPSWFDVGTKENYEIAKNAINQNEKVDFSKRDEIFYEVNGQVIKFSSDHERSKRLKVKAQQIPQIFPKEILTAGAFLSYPLIKGQTFYEVASPKLFKNFLTWTNQNLWSHPIDKKLSSDINFEQECHQFYKEKTLERVKVFLQRYPYYEEQKSTISKKINWSQLNSGVLSFIHGDLQFSNIIVSEKNKFCLIDWRDKFSNLSGVGDLYYDFAKLYLGCLVDFNQLKNKGFMFDKKARDSNPIVKFHSIPQFSEYESILFSLAEEKYLNSQRIKLLSYMCLINMAALHQTPLDEALFCFGLKCLTDASSQA